MYKRQEQRRLKEQAAFISVLQSHLQKEVIDYLEQDSRLGEFAERSNEDQVAVKLLLEQMLLKMKSLREELQSQAASKAEVVDTLYTMARAAEAQIERAKDSLYTMQQEQQNTASGRTSPFDYSGLEREVADLELFVEIAGRQSDRARETSHANDTSTLEPLLGLANAIARSVTVELEQVATRITAVDEGRDQVDAQQRAGMEKRQAVLNKELFVLGDVATKEELPRVLHGLSQVLRAFQDSGTARRVTDQVFFKVRASGDVHWLEPRGAAMLRLPCSTRSDVWDEFSRAKQLARTAPGPVACRRASSPGRTQGENRTKRVYRI